MTPTEEANVRLAREHFAAESAHDSKRTLATLADDITYRVVASGVVLHSKAEVARYYDLWWKAFPDVTIEIKRLVATGEWVIAENVATATHLGPVPRPAAHRPAGHAASLRPHPCAGRQADRGDRLLRPARAHPTARDEPRARRPAARVPAGLMAHPRGG